MRGANRKGEAELRSLLQRHQIRRYLHVRSPRDYVESLGEPNLALGFNAAKYSTCPLRVSFTILQNPTKVSELFPYVGFTLLLDDLADSPTLVLMRGACDRPEAAQSFTRYADSCVFVANRHAKHTSEVAFIPSFGEMVFAISRNVTFSS